MLPNIRNYKFLKYKNLQKFLSCGYSSNIPNPCSFVKSNHDLKPEYDVVIIGSGHNGLVSAAYLQKAGLSVCVLENRHIVGGAAVTEEIIPGFKFSRASYVLSLLRPFIISDLKLHDFGLKLHMREPYNSFTPIKESRWTCKPSQYLMLSSDMKLSQAEIAKFSKSDAENYAKYEDKMNKYVKAINILLDNRPPNWASNQGFLQKLKSMRPLLDALLAVKTDIPGFHEMLTAPAQKVLDKWFETDILKATLATDALIGSMAGPKTPGTGYVLLHHVMGGVNGKAGAWAYPEGGMGAVSSAMAASAAQLGASIFVNKTVTQILYKKESQGFKASSVLLFSGEEIRAKKAVFSCATPEITFKRLFPFSREVRNEIFGEEFVQAVDGIDYTSPVTKINVAVSRLPNFIAKPNSNPGKIGDQHKCTIHMNSETMADLQQSYCMAVGRNLPSDFPMIEMVIPSSVDKTLAPEGAHVCLLFTQYTPLTPDDSLWHCIDYKKKYADRVFDIVEQYAPGFKESIVGTDVLSPCDLQKIFGLTGGNIFHGSMGLDQLFWLRPVSTRASWFPETPLKGLYLCGSGAHPGGGVMGLPGYLAAKALLK